MQKTIANCRLMDMASLGIVDEKTNVRTMPITFISQLAMQLKNMRLKLALKLDHTGLIALAAPKLAPS